MYDVYKIREDFPILKEKVNGKPLVYLDNSATTQKPTTVIEAICQYYRQYNANIHRGVHYLGIKATEAYEKTRKDVAEFIKAPSTNCIIFTKGTTESINLIAYSWGRKFLKKGDEILLTLMEHHSNIVPWQILSKEKDIKIKFAPLNNDGTLNLNAFKDLLSEKTKLVSITYVSNVLGVINPIKDITELAHKVGALVLLDGAQGVPSIPINVQELDVDFLAFSAHKMLGPTGVGILYGKEELLDIMDPFLGGGEMIKKVTEEYSIWADIPYKFEGGTQNIAGVIGFGKAIEYLNSLGLESIYKHEKSLVSYALKRLLSVEGITIYGPTTDNHRLNIISFNYKNIHPHDVATILDQEGIAVRAGHHCAQPLHLSLGISASCRASFYLYNTQEEVDKFIEALKRVDRTFKNGNRRTL